MAEAAVSAKNNDHTICKLLWLIFIIAITLAFFTKSSEFKYNIFSPVGRKLPATTLRANYIINNQMRKPEEIEQKSPYDYNNYIDNDINQNAMGLMSSNMPPNDDMGRSLFGVGAM